MKTFGNKPIVYGGDLAKPLPAKDYLLPHFGFGAGRVNMVTARGGVGKTLAVQALALAVAGDLDKAWGLAVKRHGKVLHLDYEMGTDVIARYQRLARPLGIDLANLGERLGVVTFPGVYMTSDTFFETLGQLCKGLTLLVLDSFAAAGMGLSSGENDSSARLFLDCLTRISEATGVTIIVIHHDGKGGKARGSSAIEDAVGSHVDITVKNEVMRLAHEKPTSGARAEPVHLRIVDVGERDFLSGTCPGLAVEPTEPNADKLAALDAKTDVDARTRKVAKTIRDFLSEQGEPQSSNAITEAVGAQRARVQAALAFMLSNEAVKVTDGPRGAKLYELNELEEVDRG